MNVCFPLSSIPPYPSHHQDPIIESIHPHRERIIALDAELLAISIKGDWSDEDIQRSNVICKELRELTVRNLPIGAM